MKLFRRIGKRFIPQAQYAYSQFGEDLILSHLFADLGISQPSYLDIGANEPRYISNTYYFYLRKSRGVLVEPNPSLFRKLKKYRPHDIVLNTGIGFTNIAEADFYVFPDFANGLSTFSKKEAEHWQNTGMKGLGKINFERIIKMPLVSINTLMEQHFKNQSPNFVSIDVEGLDLEILKSFDFNQYQPEAFCVETLAYNENKQGFKLTQITDFMHQMNYSIYADTRVNTIYCRNDIFET